MNLISRIIIAGLVSCSVSSNAVASAYHQFFNIAYDNPAMLNDVKKGDLILGDTYVNPTFHFNGSNGPLVGSTTSRENTNLPYGRLAYRFSPKVVASLDITHLVYTDIEYPVNEVLSTVSTGTIVRDVNISPRISYQVSPQLAIGAGINADYAYDITLNFTVPPNQFKSNASDWKYGFTAGLYYVLTPKTFLGLSYFSKLLHEPRGTSSWGPASTNNYKVNLPIPAVTILNLTQLLTDKWLLSGYVRYVEWSTFQYLVLQNTALGVNLTTKQDYNNIFNFVLATHYQVNDKFGFLAGGEYDANPQPTQYRSPGLPTYSVSALFLGADYTFNKSVTAKLVYAHAFSNPSINLPGPAGQVIGRENINVNVVDFSLIWHMA